ncbi:MAG: carboxylesterase family protein [Bryobacteraceae bacterium]|nr:carboxylesterase family protein [Bryobacteraceae bacterium]
MIRVPIFLSFTMTVALAAGGAFAASGTTKIDTGRLKGVVKDGVVSFKGIPYSAPPVGELRWRPPQPAKAWSGIRPASEYGADCMQKPFPGDAAPLGVTPAEDCLYVNVWIPAQAPARRLPVMVWIYGGGFVNGGSSPAVYDGSAFARRGVVFVSFNYRVGRFGFFAHPALTKENPSEPHGNYAYMDQIALLKWVQRNAAAFGGDPGNVTLFGESAGGMSVQSMMTSPLARGLFHKAIIESGGGRSGGIMPPRYLDRAASNGTPSAETAGTAFAKSVKIEGGDAAALAALRKLPAEAVVAGLNMASMMTPTYSGPMIDGKVIVEPSDAAFLAGRATKIPLMVGANSADIGFSMARNIDELFKPFGAASEAAKAAWDPEKTGNVREVGALLAADRMMVEPARFLARAAAASGQTAYEFRFSYVAESMRKQWKGAPHATEIPFVFDTVEARYGKALAPADKSIAQAANAYWVNFAKTGNPNAAGLPDWPAHTAATGILMDFRAPAPLAYADPWKARLDLAESLANAAK